MRVRIDVVNSDERLIPYNYQYQLASMIYSRIKDTEEGLANRLHSSGNPKLFTFSWFLFNDASFETGINFKEAWFYLSSPDDAVPRCLCEGLLNKPFFSIHGVRMEVVSLASLETKNLDERVRFSTLSPIYLKAVRRVGNTWKGWDLYPDDERWTEALYNNLVKKYHLFSGNSTIKDKDFKIKLIGSVHRKRMKIAGSYRRCAMLDLEVEGDPRLLNFGYESGFGEKNAMGFGCVEVVS